MTDKLKYRARGVWLVTLNGVELVTLDGFRPPNRIQRLIQRLVCGIKWEWVRWCH